MNLYYVELEWGCGLRAAANQAKAKRDALEEEGSRNFKSIRLATQEDVAWIKGMGGIVPEGRVVKV